MKRVLILLFPAMLLSACETHPQRASYPEYPSASASNVPRPAPTTPVTVAPTHFAPHTGTAPRATADLYMDRQEADLRRDLRGSGFLVARQGNNLVLNMRSDVLFQPNSTTLSPEGERFLNLLGGTLHYYNLTAIEVDGYTDTSGPNERNLTISQKRAEAVAGAIETGGVDPKRIKTQGFGETNLKIPTGDNVNEPRNRRIEIHIIPSGLG